MTSSQPGAWRSPLAWVLFILTLALGLSADLWTKSAVFEHLGDRTPPTVEVIPGVLRYTLSTNPGIVFGLRLPPVAVVLATLAAIGVFTALFATSHRRTHLVHAALGMILAGALGNLYDRLWGYAVIPGQSAPAVREVRDFIDVSQLGYPWIFNMADVLLVVGVAIVMIGWVSRSAHERSDRARGGR